MIVLSGSVGHGGQNHAADVLLVRQRLRSLGFDWLPDTPEMDPDTVEAIRLFQAIKGGHQQVRGNPECDGLVQPGHDTDSWLQADNAPRWQLMPAGSPKEGFFSVERADDTDQHDFCTSWLANTLSAAAAAYLADYLSAHPGSSLVLVNDASLPHGGDTPDHVGHETGMSCDIRLPRRPGIEQGPTTWRDAEYDREALRAMLRALWGQPLLSRIFCNDEVLIAEKLCSHAAGHDDHAHVEIRPPQRASPSLPNSPPVVASRAGRLARVGMTPRR